MTNKRYLEGVYCDVELTLINSFERKINKRLLSDLEKLAEEKKVYLWTGGNPQEMKKELSDLGISQFPVLSKYDFEGCTAEHVIDDYSKEKFEKQYKINAIKYQEINPEWAM